MPLSLDPDAVVDVCLPRDEGKPLEKRPTFQFKFLTCRQLRKVQELRKTAAATTDDAESDRLINEALLVGLAGWRNMGRPFAASDVEDVVTPNERWWLINEYPGRVMLSESEKKASPSSLTVAGAKSAETAVGESAKESPASPSPSSSETSAPPAMATATNENPAPPVTDGVAK